MITGSVFFTGPVPSIITSVDHQGTSELTFYPVTHNGFNGGFYLHPLLPYKAAEVYYADKAGDIMVLLSGSVYNNSELNQLLSSSAPIPDPELIANLFLQEGPAFVEKLNGDFTIFIFQPGKKQSFLFRDHLGIRPLAWTTDQRTLFFSSDIIGLCRTFADGLKIDSEYLLGYFKYINFRKTPNKLIKKLPSGHFLQFSGRGIKIRQYWEPEKIRIDRRLPYEKMLSDLKEIVLDAVRIRCDHRFVAGAHVSSGIDSGFVSILARKEYPKQRPFYGYSWSPGNFVPKNIKFDERDLVIKSCEKADISPLFSSMNTTDFQRIICDYYGNQGYFSEDNTVEQAVEVSTNLLFSGWGGDDFISTGDVGIDLDLLRGMKLRTFFRRNPINKPKKLVKRLLYRVFYPALGILDPRISRSCRSEVRYIKKPYKKSDRKALSNFFFHTSRHQMHLKVLRFYYIQERCESWHVLGFRKGVEYRYPLLDKRIIEYMLKVPSELLCMTDYFRPLLREIGKDILPEEVRLNESKNDPVYFEYMDMLLKESAFSIMQEVNEWKTNPDLHFIDFDLLLQDINKFKESPGSVNEKLLFISMVNIKAIHKFTVTYRKER